MITKFKIFEEIRWWRNGKLGDEEPDDNPESIFNADDRVISSDSKYYYWNDEKYNDREKTSVNHNGKWVRHDSGSRYTIEKVNHCENIDGYTGQIVKFYGVWPWFQVTNLNKI